MRVSYFGARGNPMKKLRNPIPEVGCERFFGVGQLAW